MGRCLCLVVFALVCSARSLRFAALFACLVCCFVLAFGCLCPCWVSLPCYNWHPVLVRVWPAEGTALPLGLGDLNNLFLLVGLGLFILSRNTVSNPFAERIATISPKDVQTQVDQKEDTVFFERKLSFKFFESQDGSGFLDTTELMAFVSSLGFTPLRSGEALRLVPLLSLYYALNKPSFGLFSPLPSLPLPSLPLPSLPLPSLPLPSLPPSPHETGEEGGGR